jgi:hypothetical protein
MHPTNIRLDPDELERAEALVGPLTTLYPAGFRLSRAGVLRLAVIRGLRELERETGLPVDRPSGRAKGGALEGLRSIKFRKLPESTATYLPNGYYRAEGLSPEWPTFWQVLTYIPSDGGAPYVSAWGLSLWGRDGSTPTWAYRTFGSRLAKLFARYPDALWFPDHDRVPEMSVAR